VATRINELASSEVFPKGVVKNVVFFGMHFEFFYKIPILRQYFCGERDAEKIQKTKPALKLIRDAKVNL